MAALRKKQWISASEVLGTALGQLSLRKAGFHEMPESSSTEFSFPYVLQLFSIICKEKESISEESSVSKLDTGRMVALLKEVVRCAKAS